LLAANRLYNLSAKDGTEIGTFSRYAIFEPLFDNPSARFVPERFNWIGNVSIDVSICVTSRAANVQSLAEFMTRDLKLGTTNAGYISILDNVFGAKLTAIKGYPGGNEVNLALDRGEVDGRCAISWSAVLATRSNWIRDKEVDVWLQFTRKRIPELAAVPLATDLAKNETQKQIMDIILVSQQLARVIVAPPGIPQERVDALRNAFDNTMKDPEFIAEAARLGAPVDPVAGVDIQRAIADMYHLPPDVLNTFKAAVGGRL
jgi:tripartite-type tricarboxylate transporter receptor subunit TctC